MPALSGSRSRGRLRGAGGECPGQTDTGTGAVSSGGRRGASLRSCPLGGRPGRGAQGRGAAGEGPGHRVWRLSRQPSTQDPPARGHSCRAPSHVLRALRQQHRQPAAPGCRARGPQLARPRPLPLTCCSQQPPPLPGVPAAPRPQHVHVVRAVWAGGGGTLAGAWGPLKQSKPGTRVSPLPGWQGQGWRARRIGPRGLWPPQPSPRDRRLPDSH